MTDGFRYQYWSKRKEIHDEVSLGGTTGTLIYKSLLMYHALLETDSLCFPVSQDVESNLNLSNLETILAETINSS